MQNKVEFIRHGGIIGNEQTKKHKPVVLNSELVGAEAFMAVVLRNQNVVEFFGSKDTQDEFIQTAFDEQEDEEARENCQTVLHANNFIQESYFGTQATEVNLSNLSSHLNIKDVAGTDAADKAFNQTCEALEKISTAFILDSQEGENEGEEDGDAQQGDDKDAEDAENIYQQIQDIQEGSRNLRYLLKKIPCASLSKILQMKVTEDSEYFKVISGFRWVFAYSKNLKHDAVKIDSKLLIQLYLGLALNGIQNKDRVEFINWVKEQNFENEALNEEDDVAVDDKSAINIMGRWLNLLAEVLDMMRQCDLEKTSTKSSSKVKKYKSQSTKWCSAPVNDDINVTLVRLTPEANFTSRNFKICVIDGASINTFENVEVSYFQGQQNFNLEFMRKKLSGILNIENKNYIMARQLNSKEVVFSDEKSRFDNDLMNDVVYMYSVPSSEYKFVQNKSKEFVFFKISNDICIPVALEINKTLKSQLGEVKQALEVYYSSPVSQITFQKLSNDILDAQVSKLISKCEESHLGLTAPLIAVDNHLDKLNKGLARDRISIRMQPSQLMIDFYVQNIEHFRKQNFDLSVMGASIIGLDISSWSTMINFSEKFKLDMKEIPYQKIEGEDLEATYENEYFYRPLAVLLRKPDSKGSQLFFWKKSDEGNVWESASETNHIVDNQTIGSSMIKYAYYLNVGESEE